MFFPLLLRICRSPLSDICIVSISPRLPVCLFIFLFAFFMSSSLTSFKKYSFITLYAYNFCVFIKNLHTTVTKVLSYAFMFKYFSFEYSSMIHIELILFSMRQGLRFIFIHVYSVVPAPHVKRLFPIKLPQCLILKLKD